MNTIEDTFTATDARAWAAKINSECSNCYTSAKAVKQFGRWVIKIGGGRECCYGKTLETAEDAANIVRIFAN